MTLFHSRRSADGAGLHAGLLEDLERLLRRTRALLLAAPVLLLVGFGAGEVVKTALRIPENAPIRLSTGREVPGGRLDAHSSRMLAMEASGKNTVGIVEMYREHVQPVETVLRRRGVSSRMARQISWPLVAESRAKGLDPATVVAILMIESGGKPTARSPVGATGLMQVMPAWVGRWRGCGRDLTDVKDNLCNGTSILAWYLRRHGTDERKALLGYNGCVRGTNTANCFAYPDKIWRLRDQIKTEMTRERARLSEAATDE